MQCGASNLDNMAVKQPETDVVGFSSELDRVLCDVPVVMTSIAEQRIMLFVGHQVKESKMGELHGLLAGASFVDSVVLSSVGEGFLLTISLNVECDQKISRISSVLGGVLLPKIIASAS